MKRNIIIAAIVVVAALVGVFVWQLKKVDTRAAAAAFPSKKWYYSVDGGKTWTGRAEADLKGFSEKGEPIHVKPEWVWGEWQDENTIFWTAINNTTSIWKSFDVQLTPKQITKMKAYAAAFANKKWSYSGDDGKNWVEGAEEDLKGFDENGTPIHVSPAWISGVWEDENTIRWIAVNGNVSIWKSFDGSTK